MATRCPGQDMKNLRVRLYKCPKCKTKVYSDMQNSCIDWCASARECLGEERWKELRGGKQEPAKKL